VKLFTNYWFKKNFDISCSSGNLMPLLEYDRLRICLLCINRACSLANLEKLVDCGYLSLPTQV